jgi:hypothetical protein
MHTVAVLQGSKEIPGTVVKNADQAIVAPANDPLTLQYRCDL